MSRQARGLTPVEHRLIGRPDQVAAVLRAAQARGHLLGMSQPVALRGYRVQVTVTLLQPPTAAIQREVRLRRWRKLWRITKPILIALAVTGAVAGLGWLGWLLYRLIVAHWVPLVVIGVVGLFAASAVTAMNDHERRYGGRR